MAQLAVYMNGYRVGTFSKATSGARSSNGQPGKTIARRS